MGIDYERIYLYYNYTQEYVCVIILRKMQGKKNEARALYL
jgi:hypothetical protein